MHLLRLKSLWHFRSLAFAGGALFPLALAPFNVWPLAFLCTGLLAWILQQGSVRDGFYSSLLFGLGMYGTGASWVYVSIHNFGAASIPLAGFLTGLFAFGLAILFAVPFYFYRRFFCHKTWTAVFAFAGIWVLGEWCRAWFLTGFPWLFVGYSQLATPLSGFAPLGGVLSVSLATVLISTGLLQAWMSRQLPWLILPVLLIGGGAILNTTTWTNPTGKPLTVAMVQANIPQEKKWQPDYLLPTLDRYRELTAPLWASSDWIIWPEAAIPLTYHRAEPFLDSISETAKATNTALITGILYDDFDNRKVFNSIAGLGNAEGLYHKQHLVPFGEYVPMEWLRNTIEFFNMPTSHISPGPEGQSNLNIGDVRLAAALCYEVVFPDLVRESANQAEILLTISNDAWFGDSLGPHQHMQMAQMRALENGRYLIRGTNNGITAVVDPQGKITDRIPQFVEATLQAKVQPQTGQTPFMQYGSLPVVLLSILLLIPALVPLKHRNKVTTAVTP